MRAVDAKTVRVVLRPRFAGWQRAVRDDPPEPRSLGQEPARIWTDGIDNPKTGAPIGSGPFLVERWERGTLIVSAAIRATGGAGPGSTGSSFATG